MPVSVLNPKLYMTYEPFSGGAEEASSIYKSGSYYYLFTSWDNCCSGKRGSGQLVLILTLHAKVLRAPITSELAEHLRELFESARYQSQFRRACAESRDHT